MKMSFRFFLLIIFKTIFFHLVFVQANTPVIYPAKSNLFGQAEQDTVMGFRASEKVDSENLSHIKEFTSINTDELDHKASLRDASFAKFLAPQEGARVVADAHNHPVVSLWKYSKYDPENRGIGFCFGRAMFIHLDLYYRGFDRDSIRKAFVVGPMKTPDGGSWGWHVTTIAQSLDSKGRRVWLALDPIFDRNSKGKIPTLQEWYQEMYGKYSTDKKLKLYVTEAGKFGPSPSPYDAKSIKQPFYNNYFKDMMDWFESQSQEGRYQSRKIEDYKTSQCRSLF